MRCKIYHMLMIVLMSGIIAWTIWATSKGLFLEAVAIFSVGSGFIWFASGGATTARHSDGNETHRE